MSYKNVVCLYPYFQEVPIYEFFPPLGLEYIAAAIEDLVGSVTVVDLRYEEDFTGIKNSDADLYCVSVNWHYEYDSVREVIRSLPPDVTTVVGGKFATVNVEDLFEQCPNIDVVVRGDGEETIREFVEKGSPVGVNGLSYRGDNGIVHNDTREPSDVSDQLFPNRKNRRYQYKISYRHIGLGYTFDSMASSQGCPFKCKFCSFKSNPLGQQRGWSARSPESVIEELKQIDAKVVAFIDDNFFVDIPRAEKICDLIIENKINKIFLANARILVARHPELLKKMYKAGFRLLMIGLESAQDKSLKSLQKGFKTADAQKAFEVLRKSNILTNGYFIVGLIGETEEEMLEIAPYAKSLGVDLISPNRLRYEKYSGLVDMLKENDDYYVGEHNRIYSKQYGPKEINRITKKISSEFFDGAQIASIARKGLRIGFPGWRLWANAVVKLPKIYTKTKNRKKRPRAAAI